MAGVAEGLKAMREKHWGELDDKGRIERMREIVLSLQARNCSLEDKVNQLLRHNHDTQGDVRVTIRDGLEPRGERERARFGPDKDSVYF